MEDKKIQRRIKLVIGLIIIFVFIIGILFTMILNFSKETKKQYNQHVLEQSTDNTKNSYYSEITDNPEDYKNIDFIEEDGYKNLEYEYSRKTYFTINSLYNKYINFIGNKNKDSLKNILSEEYKSQYNITDNNIFDKLVVPSLTNSSQYYKPIITDMLTAQIDSNIHIYIIKGKCRIVNMENTILNINVMLEIDTSNNLYCVYPYQYIKDKGYDNLQTGQTINYTPEKIEKNDNNEFEYITKTDSEMASEYFDNYKELLKYYTDEAYNKLNSEYSKKRFGSKEKFETYLNDNKTTLALMSINKYKANSYQNYTDYICSDKYDNIYIFRQQGGIMRYSVFLDNYTVMLDEDVQYYNELEKFDKGKYNLSKFIKQVNTKDYTAIYNSLDNTFKSNNFKTQANLKKYIQNNLYDLNSIEIENVDNETYEYYVFECKVTDLRNSTKTKNMTVILNQGEGTDYTMSFSVQ